MTRGLRSPIVNGTPEVNEKEGAAVRKAFEMYLRGAALSTIGNELGINRYHASVARILEDQKYLGTDFYPAIVEKELFDKVQKTRATRRKKHSKPCRIYPKAQVSKTFQMDPIKQVLTDLFEQAQYIFGLIQAKE